MEFALVLPFLALIALGVSDFGGAFNLKQKLNNAAREGVRFSISLSCVDCWQSPPPSTQAVRDVVTNYLTNARVTTCAVGTAPTQTGPLTWQYASTTTGNGCAGFALRIERGYTFVNSSGILVVGSRVTLVYPVSWTLGNFPGLPTAITTDAIMENLI